MEELKIDKSALQVLRINNGKQPVTMFVDGDFSAGKGVYIDKVIILSDPDYRPMPNLFKLTFWEVPKEGYNRERLIVDKNIERNNQKEYLIEQYFKPETQQADLKISFESDTIYDFEVEMYYTFI